jgi:Tfp pilus assembly protein PilX
MRPFTDSLRARPGFALAAAMGGIVVIGVLIGGVFFMTTQDVRISGGAVAQERAFRAAELGLNTTLAQWNNLAMASADPGYILVQAHAGDGWVDTVRVTKLSETTYSLVSTAVVHHGTLRQARKSTGMAVRVAYADFNLMGALTVRGDTKIGGSSYVSGFDSNPASWNDCPVATDTMPGVAIGGGTFTQTGSNVVIDGQPPVLDTTAAADTTNYFRFGDLDWAALTASATKIYNGTRTLTGLGPLVNADGSCNTGLESNWGEPVYSNTVTASCQNYFPIIHARNTGGVLKITGGRGQGILLVDGNLEIEGGFEFYGPVIVRGYFKTAGTGGKVTGGVMAANVELEQNVVLGNATVRYSNCVIEKAKRAAASPRRLAHRAWVDLH